MIDLLSARAALSLGAVVAAADASQATEPRSVVIAAIAAATLGILAVLIPGIIAIINAVRSTKAVVQATAAVNVAQDRKLTTITHLVDGSVSDILQELADLKLALSVATGLKADKVKADDAQQKADAQHARVEAAVAIEARAADDKPDKEDAT